MNDDETYGAIGTDDLAENSVLAACLQSLPARKACRRLIDGKDFLHPGREIIWRVMSDFDRTKRPVDISSVASMLMSKDSPTTAARGLLIALAGHPAIPEHAEQYAQTVREWAVRRRLAEEGAKVKQQAANLDVDVTGLTSAIAARFAALRDHGSTEDAQSVTLGELLAEPDDEPDWVIPEFLERRDRLILTGGEGLGKSYLLRQIAIMAAAGLDPFDPMYPIKPAKVLIIDCENSLRQVKRKSRAVVEFAARNGTGRPDQVNFLPMGRIDITQDKPLATIHREIEVTCPDIIVIGPIYAMSPKALMTDDDAVPVLAALDGMRESGAALLMEAHAGHGAHDGVRNFRPRGSSALMGWPEFGYGLKPGEASNYAELVPWRGDRDARAWPRWLKHDGEHIRWIEHDGAGVVRTNYGTRRTA